MDPVFIFLVAFIALNSILSVANSRSILSSGGVLHDDVSCSKIWNFFGSQIHIGQNEGYGNLGVYNFIPNAVQMRKGCFLTIQDDMGVVTETDATVPPGSQCWERPISFACCECFGCFGAYTPKSPTACAVLYEHPDCSACLGVRFEVESGDSEAVVNATLHDKISSVIVKPGCELKIYKNTGFSGDAAVVTGMIEILHPEWNDEISSYQCTCPGGSTEIIMSTLPPVWTVSTTVAPLTNPPSNTTEAHVTNPQATPSTSLPITDRIPVTNLTSPITTEKTIAATSSSVSTTTPIFISTTEEVDDDDENKTSTWYPLY